jgi:hypothetical protein
MSYTPPRAIRSAVHQASLQDGSPVAGPSRSHTTPAKNANYSPSANLSPGISVSGVVASLRPTLTSRSFSEPEEAFSVRHRRPSGYRVSIFAVIVAKCYSLPLAAYHSLSPGSRIWKVGFSGEARPRKVFWASTPDELDAAQEGEMWGLDLEAMADQMNMELAFTTTDESQRIETPVKYEEVLRVIKARLTTALRKVYSK